MHRSLGRRTKHGNQHAAPAWGTADDQHERSPKNPGVLNFQIFVIKFCITEFGFWGKVPFKFLQDSFNGEPKQLPQLFESFEQNSSNFKWCQFSAHAYPSTFLVDTGTEMDPSPTGTDSQWVRLRSKPKCLRGLGHMVILGGVGDFVLLIPPVSMTVALIVFLSYCSLNILTNFRLLVRNPKYIMFLVEGTWAGHQVLTTAILWYDSYMKQNMYCVDMTSKVTSQGPLPRGRSSTINHIPLPATRIGQTTQQIQIYAL